MDERVINGKWLHDALRQQFREHFGADYADRREYTELPLNWQIAWTGVAEQLARTFNLTFVVDEEVYAARLKERMNA